MIEFSHVSKLFGAQKAVNDLNLNFQEGSFSVLIGTSGSGKADLSAVMFHQAVNHFQGGGFALSLIHIFGIAAARRWMRR